MIRVKCEECGKVRQTRKRRGNWSPKSYPTATQVQLACGPPHQQLEEQEVHAGMAGKSAAGLLEGESRTVAVHACLPCRRKLHDPATAKRQPRYKRMVSVKATVVAKPKKGKKVKGGQQETGQKKGR